MCINQRANLRNGPELTTEQPAKRGGAALPTYDVNQHPQIQNLALTPRNNQQGVSNSTKHHQNLYNAPPATHTTTQHKTNPIQGRHKVLNQKPLSQPQEKASTVFENNNEAADRAREQQDRENRRKNLVVLGVKEKKEVDDLEIMEQMLIFLDCGHRLSQMKSVTRLGEKITKGKNRGKRPILVKFENERARKEVYDKSPRLSGSDFFCDIYVKADLPAPQRSKGDRMTNAWTEAARRHGNRNEEPQASSKDSGYRERSGGLIKTDMGKYTREDRASHSRTNNQAASFLRNQRETSVSDFSDYSEDNDYSDDDGYDSNDNCIVIQGVKYFVRDSWEENGKPHLNLEAWDDRIGSGGVHESVVYIEETDEPVVHMSGNERNYRPLWVV